MGCGSSAFDEQFSKPAMQDCLRQFKAMQFSNSDIRKLYDIFRAVDVDGSGSIALSELLTHIHLDRTPFTEKIFSIFDDDRSGEIDFKEFVMSLWNYCTLTKATLDMFAFDLYDRDGSGELSPTEVTRMVQDIYGKGEAKTNFHAKSIISELHALDLAGKVLNIDHFSSFAKNHQALLFPAFQMQSALRRNILGANFWERHAEKRIKFTNGKYVSVGQFIVAHLGGKSGGAALPQMHAAEDNRVYRVHDEVHDLVEAAGNRAARRKSVAKHQTDRHSFGMDESNVPAENTLGIDSRASLTESAKIRFMAGLMSMGVGKQRRGSVAPAPAPVAGQLLSPQDSSHITSPSPSLSHINSSAGISVPPSRKLSAAQQNGVILNAAAAGMTSPFVSPRDRDHGKREGNRRHSRDEGLSGTASPGLTMNAVGKIEPFAPIEAWQNHGSGGKRNSGSAAAGSALTGAHIHSAASTHARRGSMGASPPTVGMLISDHPSAHPAAGHGHGHGNGHSDAAAKRRRSSFGT